MGRLAGKVAVVTGATSGIGEATARRFAAEGATVYLFGRRQQLLDAVVSEIGAHARGIRGDTQSFDDLDRLFETVKAEQGRIDVLFANAGLGNLQPLGAITPESFDLTFGVNVRGTLFTVQKALPLLTRGSSVILTGSTTGQMGTFAFSVYAASKAAIRNLARNWAVDLKGTGIRVNVLSPGTTGTPGLMDGLAATGMGEQLLAGMIEQAPLGRIADASEIAAAALFLASDESGYMTGSEIFVDGGSAQI
jgi:NAD(P)-dependent dehydrogenase (short-subunit alcohol dehydrogenase family)